MGDTVGPNKAIAGAAAGALTIIMAWVIQSFGHVTIPAEVAGAFTTLLTVGAVYAVPHGGDG